MKDFQNFPKYRRQVVINAHALPLFERAYSYDELQVAAEIVDSLLVDQTAPAFMLPEDGMVMADDSHDIPEKFNIPFSKMTLEYGAAPASYGVLHGRIKNGEVAQFNGDRNAIATLATVIYLRQGAPDKIAAFFAFKYVVPTAHRYGEHVWGVLPYGIVLSPGCFESSGTSVTVKSDIPILLDPKVTPWSQGDRSDFFTSIAYPLRVIANFVSLCNCSNIKAEKIFEPSLALKKAAQKRGNLPPDEYYTLDCWTGEHRERGQDQGGSHASPRFHVRRGHIRRLASGGTTWVRQCSVGNADLGKITKDYNVIGRLANA